MTHIQIKIDDRQRALAAAEKAYEKFGGHQLFQEVKDCRRRLQAAESEMARALAKFK